MIIIAIKYPNEKMSGMEHLAKGTNIYRTTPRST